MVKQSEKEPCTCVRISTALYTHFHISEEVHSTFAGRHTSVPAHPSTRSLCCTDSALHSDNVWFRSPICIVHSVFPLGGHIPSLKQQVLLLGHGRERRRQLIAGKDIVMKEEATHIYTWGRIRSKIHWVDKFECWDRSRCVREHRDTPRWCQV